VIEQADVKDRLASRHPSSVLGLLDRVDRDRVRDRLDEARRVPRDQNAEAAGE
jgi:hypothetical protein